MIRGASVSSSLKRCRTLGRPASARQTLWEKSSQETSWRGVSSGWNGVTGRDHDEPQAKNRYNHSVLLLNQRREYHATAQMERAGPALFLGLGAVAATAKAGQYAARAYQEYQASLPTEEELKKQQAADAEKEGAKTSAQDQKGQDANKQEKKADGKRENVFAKFFNLGVGSKYYEGGFESEMTRREAALVLGVRESSSPKRIKEAHRNLLILNHPDTGGSTYVAGKINEAKELLIKGRKAL